MTRPSFLLPLLLLAAACSPGADRAAPPKQAAGASAARAEPQATEWERVDYAAQLVPAEKLGALSLEELQHLRAIIFGRQGRVFQNDTLQRWLVSRPWYHPDTAFTNARLSARERENLDLVRAAEAARHAHIESGDLRFHDAHVITTAMLGTHSPQDWEVLAAEVLANHGFVFEDELDDDDAASALSNTDLQHYFDERYWYRRDPDFGADGLTAIERQNLDTIRLAMTRQLGRTVSPGMMNLFHATPLSEAMLQGVSIADLRVLRNEVYARHGREFNSAWVREQFRRYPWYAPRRGFSEAELSDVERANVATIVQREQRLHEELGTRLLTVGELRGLPPDDARRLRNEIYARHGRRFRDSKLQRYFESFAWYRPSSAVAEAALNDTERKNVDLISQYESGRFTEG